MKKFLLVALLTLAGAVHALEVTGAGSSAAKPLYSLWAQHYKTYPEARIDYQPVGSSEGRRQIIEGKVNFGASDVALNSAETRKYKLICFPTAISGVVPVYNVNGVKSGLRLTGEVLAHIFSRKIEMWNDPEIAALNPGLKLPAQAITIVAREDGSGTTYNFTDYLSKINAEWKVKYGNNFKIQWPAEAMLAKGSSGIANAVRQTKGAIGYIDYNYVIQEHLSYAVMQNRQGSFVTPSPDAFRSALNNSSWKTEGTFEEMLTNRMGIDSWPITMGTFVMVPQVADDPEKTIATLKFFTWGFLEGDHLVGSLDFVRLPDPVQARIYRILMSIRDRNGAPLRWNIM